MALSLAEYALVARRGPVVPTDACVCTGALAQQYFVPRLNPQICSQNLLETRKRRVVVTRTPVRCAAEKEGVVDVLQEGGSPPHNLACFS
jgi:hypothetical protein